MSPDLETALARLNQKGARLPQEPAARALLSPAAWDRLGDNRLRAQMACVWQCEACPLPFQEYPGPRLQKGPILCQHCAREARRAKRKRAGGSRG